MKTKREILNFKKVNKKSGLLSVCIFSVYLFLQNGMSFADDTSFSDDPMETKVQAAASNVMFLLDNSGSMGWDFMTTESEGLFNGHEFLYGKYVDNNYYSGTLNGTDRHWWKSQWSGYNGIFYNPTFPYNPWAEWNVMDDTENDPVTSADPPFNADIINPRTNPVDKDSTLDLHGNYFEWIPSSGEIVDDRSSANANFLTIGTWSPSGSTPRNDGDAKYTENNGAVIYTPTIGSAGKYKVFAIWNCYSRRDSNALFIIDTDNSTFDYTDSSSYTDSERRSQKADTDDVVKPGYCGEWLPLFDGESFDLQAGLKTSVAIARDGSSTNVSTVADAVAFVPEDDAIVYVNNAHYYVVNDTDDDDVAENGEIYLVNLEWVDSNADEAVDTGEVNRTYYEATQASTDKHTKITKLKLLSSADVPDAIIPKDKDPEGNVTGNVTPYADLQNFANWFSFFRNRDLTAKAAVGGTVNDINGVYVGYYTINSAVRKGVQSLGVGAGQTSTVEVDTIYAKDSNSDIPGSWNTSGRSPELNNKAYWTDDKNVQAKFTPVLDAGKHTVYGWWPCSTSTDKDVVITITHSGGVETKNVNQRASNTDVTTKDGCFDTNGAGCCGYWVDLGEYTFPELDGDTTAPTITVERDSSPAGTSHAYVNAFKFEAEITTFVNKTDELLNDLYGTIKPRSGGTPLRTGLLNVGRYYDDTDSNNGNIGDSPLLPASEGGACQQCFTIAMTDGFWNGNSPGVGDLDDDAGPPYVDAYGSTDSWSNTLADVAIKYYDIDLSTDLDNDVPTNNYDKKSTQHMVTYAVSFGLSGSVLIDDINGDGTKDNPSYADDPFFLKMDDIATTALDGTPIPVWPEPTGTTGSKIDDLWHASVNGRGKYFSASNPEALVTSLKDIFDDIGSRTASGASVSVNGDELSTGLVLYQSSYQSGSWTGDVTAYPIDSTTGEILKGTSDIIWKAADQLQLQGKDDRFIVAFDGENGIPFQYNSLTMAQKEVLQQDSTMVPFLRGEETSGFRSRTQMLGDVIHSAPLLIAAQNPENDGYDNDGDLVIDETGEKGGTIYTGGNDGLLHAFNAVTGFERFAYVPLRSFDYINQLSEVDYAHRYFVDATPSFKRLSFYAGDQRDDKIDNDKDGCIDGDPGGTCTNEFADMDNENYGDNIDNDRDGQVDERGERKEITLLVGAFKKGGRGIYALDVSAAEGINHNDGTLTESTIAANIVKWEYPPVAPGGLKYVFVGDQRTDGIDNDGDGCIDGELTCIPAEDANGDNEDYSDSFDNDGDGIADEAGEMWLTNADENVYVFGGDQSADGIDNDGDGCIDGAATCAPAENADGDDEDYSDGIDNDGDGSIDEQDEQKLDTIVNHVPDYDMGYSFSDPAIVRSSTTSFEGFDEANSPWVVIFGNGYRSKNGHAVLYVVDAMSGELIRKIDTGAGGNNGLSTPAIIDVDNDDRVDFVYAGDLKGNMWKFDLSDSDPDNWGVFYGSDVANPTGKTRIDYADVDGSNNHDIPQPLFSSAGRPITSAPDVMFHCDEKGYMVIWGSGKFLGEDDRIDMSIQTVFGVWDYGDNASQYLGAWDHSANTLANISDVKLLEQVEIDWREYTDPDGVKSKLRTLSDFVPNWYISSNCNDGIDNDFDSNIDEDDELCTPYSLSATPDFIDNNNDGQTDETGENIGHVGWFFDLPYGTWPLKDNIDNDGDGNTDEADEGGFLGERVIKDVLIRDGKIIFISFIPNESPCSGGGDSIVHEIDACTGARLNSPAFDINNDGVIDSDDMITVNGEQVAPSGKMFGGMLHTPVIVTDPDKDREFKIFSSSAGTTEIVVEEKEKTGLYYWLEH